MSDSGKTFENEKEADSVFQNRPIETTGNYIIPSRNFIDELKKCVGNESLPIRELFSIDREEKSRSFEEINTEGKAYLLGCFVCGGSVTDENTWNIEAGLSRKNVIEKLRLFIGDNSQVGYFYNRILLCVFNSQWTNLFKKLEIFYNSQVTTAHFPNLPSNLIPAFLRGCFEISGFINVKESCCWFSAPSDILKNIEEKIGVKGILSESNIKFSRVNCLDFLSKIYEHSSPEFRSNSDYEEFCQLLTKYNVDHDKSWSNNSFKCLWKRVGNALPIRKNRCSDTGYDLALIRKEKQLNQFTALYDTGIAVSPPVGYYFDVVPRSSVSKTGYMLANSTGIIDASYSGTIKVALFKVNDSIPDIVLPNYMVQLIPRKYTHLDFQEVNELEQTERSDKGFGSTEMNKK